MTTSNTAPPCRTEGCGNPRRPRPGGYDVLCERCYTAAIARITAELASTPENAAEARQRYRHAALNLDGSGPRTARPDHVAPALSVLATSLGSRAGTRPQGKASRLISDELVGEAYRIYQQETDGGRPLSIRKVAERILPDTGYRDAATCQNALQRQWERRGWPRRTAGQALPAAPMPDLKNRGAAPARTRGRLTAAREGTTP